MKQRTARHVKHVSMDEVTAETATYYDVEEQVYLGFRYTATGRKIAANLCRRWIGEPREIARPNNDTLYISALIDLRKDPVILKMPAFDSAYVSLMVTGYDHYVNVPLATRFGDFKKPEKILFYTERTEGYDGKPVDGAARIFECTGDFISAVLRIMPHAKDQERSQRILGQMKQVKIATPSEFRGGESKAIDDTEFPAIGKRDADIFENNLLEVMQFVFNHTTFDPKDELDQELFAAYEPLGIAPGQSFDSDKVAKIDGAELRKVS